MDIEEFQDVHFNNRRNPNSPRGSIDGIKSKSDAIEVTVRSNGE